MSTAVQVSLVLEVNVIHFDIKIIFVACKE